MEQSCHSRITKATPLGILVTLGIVFGDLGTSPLYVMRAIVAGSGGAINSDFIYGALSCIIWTLTIQTTLKYVIITIRADNQGEGGIFSLYALVRKYSKHTFVFAIIGGAMLLADGVITPSITVTSAVEGTLMIVPDIPVLPIVIAIIAFLFFVQRFGTKVLGKSFGPIMLIWFITLGVLGFSQIPSHWGIFKSFNPMYAIRLLADNPGGFLLLGAIFLCTTGAEALYSDIGHCGKPNIRISWFFVKIMLILNYLGQGAWILNHQQTIMPGDNPFFLIMPQWFIPFGVLLSTLAAIIASQALISGSYTIISEAIHLNFWPKVKIKYPSVIKGQLYIPSINILLWALCTMVIIGFRDSARMEAAYGLSITLTMLMTTFLVSFFLRMKKVSIIAVVAFLAIYLPIEGAFLISNLNKFSHGGWFTLLLGSFIILVMFIWHKGRKIKNRFLEFDVVHKHIPALEDLSKDTQVQKYSSNLAYITKANNAGEIESKILYSIFNKRPKRADHYWLLHINITDEPYQREYKITEIRPGLLTRIDFNIGFRVNPRVNLFFKQVIADMIDCKELDALSQYPSLRKHHISSDFRYIVIDRVQTYDFDFPPVEQFVMDWYTWLSKLGISDVKQYGLDTSNVDIEKVPLNTHIINHKFRLNRLMTNH